MSTSVWPLNREPYHGDIVQGQLGNCFLIVSLQALASCQPRLLKSIISLSPLACYFHRQGQRIEIPIVLEPITEEYPYCRSTVANIQWPYIIEQAYAKFYGSRFENLAGGNTSEALYDLLGKPVEEFEMNDKDLWEKVQRGLTEKNVIVTCGAVITNVMTQTNAPNGLVYNHAYAILATYFEKQTRERYVLIHNPQGINHLLKENIRVRQAFFTMKSKEHPLWSNTNGTQIILWSELQKTCNRVQICYLNVESHQILFGNWSEMTNGGCSNFSTFYRNPFILFPPSYTGKIVLILGHTTDQRSERTTTDIKLNYIQFGIAIIQLKPHSIPTHDNYEIICQSKFWNKREVALAVDIEQKHGLQYTAVLSTYYPNINNSFWVEIFSKQSLLPIELRTWTSQFQQIVQTIHGEWHQGNAGGRRTKPINITFYQNPAYLLSVSDTASVCFILYQSFETFVPLAQYHPIGIYVFSNDKNQDEPTFTRARSVSRLIHLNAGEEYYVIPTCFQANSFGKFQLDILSNIPVILDPTERKLPIPPPIENKTSSGPSTARKPDMVKASVVPKRGNLSLAVARTSSLADEYSKMDMLE